MRLFVTGTDTDVGKTFISGALVGLFLKKGLKVGLCKWVSTGARGKSLDVEFILTALNDNGLIKELNNLLVSTPYCLGFPASPHLAAEIEGVEIDANKLFSETKRLEEKCDVLILEGVGGLMVPIKRDILLIDLLKRCDCKVLLVSRAGLGTINHTLLSVDALKRRGIDLSAIILNQDTRPKGDLETQRIMDDNKRTIAEISGIGVLGPVPFSGSPFDEEVASTLLPLVDKILEGPFHE